MKLKNILIIFIFASLFRNINLNAVQLNSLNYELSVYFIANSQQSVSSSNYNLNWSLDYLNNPGSSPISSSNYQFYSGAQYMFLNNSPVLIIGDTVIYSYSGNPITLNANGSFDPDSSPIQFVWSQSAGPQNFDTSIFQNSSNITIVPNISGTYIFTITVTDSDLSSVSETITAFINSSSAKSVIIETGQFQVKSINAYSDTISFYGIDEFGNLANDIAYSLQLVYPKFFSETISYDTVMSNNSVKLNLRVPSKPGSYIFALSTANDSKFIEIETPEREFYKNQWSMFTPIHESGNLYNLLSEITNNSIYQWNPASEDDEYGSKYKIPSNFEKGKSYWFKYTGIIGSENDTLTIAPTGNIIKDSSVTINLYAGWNQIGNPFYYYINWDSCLINNLSPAQAEAQNIIQNAFYWF
ncbi:hypothetical protein KA977_09990, partial [Candidatus Dependentiae bacterium]|nr:hypothetical protein [Candidatus Dependentiae bacterium]